MCFLYASITGSAARLASSLIRGLYSQSKWCQATFSPISWPCAGEILIRANWGKCSLTPTFSRPDVQAAIWEYKRQLSLFAQESEDQMRTVDNEATLALARLSLAHLTHFRAGGLPCGPNSGAPRIPNSPGMACAGQDCRSY
jgi:hypothetical protein